MATRTASPPDPRPPPTRLAAWRVRPRWLRRIERAMRPLIVSRAARR